MSKSKGKINLSRCNQKDHHDAGAQFETISLTKKQKKNWNVL